MPTERLSMRQIREVLRLRFASELSQRAIAKSLGLSQGAVSGYLSRARAAGVSWPLPEELDDVQLEALLFPPPPALAADQRPMPDWAWCIASCAARRDPAVAVGGVPRRRTRRVRLLQVLRTVPGLGGPAAADDAPDPYRRRKAVRRLRRGHHAGDRRPATGEVRAGADVRRRAGRLQLHLCRGDLERRGCRIGSARMSARFAYLRRRRRG